ncbi:MAG: peptidase, partial [Thaumarchaeota archaeon]|nr:peptidase [Nitrososphaerota archaeon]
TFVGGIQYMIKQGIIAVPPTASNTNQSQQIPAWIKNSAGWWASNEISDDDFVKGVQYLISNGIIKV